MSVALVALALAPAGLLLAGPAFADASPSPATGIGEPAYQEAGGSPQPGVYQGETVPTTVTPDGYLTGGTLQAGTSGAAPAPAAVRPAAVTPSVTTPSSVRGPAVLPFTGPPAFELQLALGAALLLAGSVVTAAARPRR